MPRATPTEDLELIESIVTAHPGGIRIADLDGPTSVRASATSPSARPWSRPIR